MHFAESIHSDGGVNTKGPKALKLIKRDAMTKNASVISWCDILTQKEPIDRNAFNGGKEMLGTANMTPSWSGVPSSNQALARGW